MTEETATAYPQADDTVANNDWFSIGALGVTSTLGNNATIAEAFAAGLNWDVAEDAAINGTTLDVVPDMKLIRRTDTNRVIGWGRQSFTPILNSDCRDILEGGLVDVGHHVAAVGSLRNGARTFVAVALDDAGELNMGGDKIKPFFVLANSFDGSSTLRLLNLAIRPGCTNVLSMALRQKDATVATIRHTSGASTRFAQVRNGIRGFLTVRDEFQAEVQRLIDTDLTSRQAADMVHALTPIPKGEDITKAAITRAESRREGLWACYADGKRNGFAGSAWGMFQAWSTWTQNDSGFRKTKNGPADLGERKIERALNGCQAEYAGLAVIDRVLAEV